MTLEPNRTDIERHLELLVSPWRDLFVAKIEFRALKENTAPSRWFSGVEPDELEQSIDRVIQLNDDQLARNVYVTVNPVRPDLTGSASDRDIITSFYAFADADNGAAASRLRYAEPKPTFFVQTGKTPEPRLHAYWRLEGTEDLSEWSALQKAIQQNLGTDSVHNPSRILRLAGTVSWPPKHKMNRGYAPEVTKLVEDF
ncbi:RepB family DNA primase [Paradonghicola geojensis]|nr:RepB family DNA primase [Marivivens geojensis]